MFVFVLKLSGGPTRFEGVNVWMEASRTVFECLGFIGMLKKPGTPTRFNHIRFGAPRKIRKQTLKRMYQLKSVHRQKV
jgi:hypothetical protein